MVTAVYIIHAGAVVMLMTSSLWDTGRVCDTDMDADLVTEYTRGSFLFAVWPVLIALCIAGHLIRLRSRPLEMASNGTGQSNK